jgi:hypothetical protein
LLQDMQWLAEMTVAQRGGRPFAAVTHCLCKPP